MHVNTHPEHNIIIIVRNMINVNSSIIFQTYTFKFHRMSCHSPLSVSLITHSLFESFRTNCNTFYSCCGYCIIHNCTNIGCSNSSGDSLFEEKLSR